MKKKILHLPLAFQSKELFTWDARIYHLAEEFSKKTKKYDFLFFAPNKNPTKQKPLFGYEAKEFQLIGPSNAYLFSPELLEATKKEQADIIHCHGINNLITFGAILIKKKNQKLIITINSAGSSSGFRKILSFPFFKVFKLLANRVDYFIAVSEYEKERFSKMLRVPIKKFSVIPNGTEKELIEKINVKKKRGLIVSTGRLVKNKGFDDLIKVFYLIHLKNKTAQLLIIGDGPERKNLEKLVKSYGIQNKVTFTGYIPKENRTTFLTMVKEAEVFVFLSKYEGLPLNVIEAITARLPCIISYNSGMKEFVDRGEAIGVNPKDHKDIRNKVLEILREPESFIPKRIYTKTWGEIADETLKIYERVLNE